VASTVGTSKLGLNAVLGNRERLEENKLDKTSGNGKFGLPSMARDAPLPWYWLPEIRPGRHLSDSKHGGNSETKACGTKSSVEIRLGALWGGRQRGTDPSDERYSLPSGSGNSILKIGERREGRGKLQPGKYGGHRYKASPDRDVLLWDRPLENYGGKKYRGGNRRLKGLKNGNNRTQSYSSSLTRMRRL